MNIFTNTFFPTMWKDKHTNESKSQLVLQICNLLISCAHKPPFIDWYLVLQVEENAALEIIRTQYRKLALQVHPDKNKHPKADMAFKFISEAYSCLCNNARRAKFNLERKNSKCFECKKVEYVPEIKFPYFTKKMKSPKNVENLVDLRARLLEEAKVMQNCLKAISESKRQNLLRNEYPVFNPADYLFQGHPHRKTNIYHDSENFRCLRKNSSVNYRLR